MTASFDQRPTERYLYRQAVKNDTIQDSSWAISPSAGTTVTRQNQTTVDTTAIVSGLTSGVTYTLTVTVTCASGQIIERSTTITCS